MRFIVGVGAVAGLGIVDGWLPGVAVEKLDGVDLPGATERLVVEAFVEAVASTVLESRPTNPD